MPVPSRPVPGQEALSFLADAEMWGQILTMLGEWQQRGRNQSLNNASVCEISISNDTTEPILAGEIRQLKTVSNQVLSGTDMIEELIHSIPNTPTFTVEDPVWHTKIDNIVVFHRSIEDGFSGPVRSPRLVSVPVTNKPSSGVNSGWAMVDPEEPKKLKFCKTSGVYKVLAWYDRSADGEDNIAVIDTQESQTLWRYQLTENSKAPNVTKSKLLDLEGLEFAPEMNLSDPDGLMDDQQSGDRGWCIHNGNQFYAIQAVC